MLLLIVLFLIFDILIVMCLGMGHKISLNKFKRREIISIIFFPNCNSMKLKINCRRKMGKWTNMWRLNNMIQKRKTIGH